MKRTACCFYKIVVLIPLFFNLIFLKSYGQHNPLLGAGNSYINVTKKVNGGFVQAGDTLEIRTNYYFGNGYNGNTIYKVRYYDSIPLKTSLCTGGPNDFLRLISNEGLVMRNYTILSNDDPATYSAAPGAGKYQVRINLGSAAGVPLVSNPGDVTDITGAGTVAIGTYRPKLFGGTLITTSFRVRVNGNAGDTIVLAAAKLVYKKTSTGIDTTIKLNPFKILISSSAAPTLCNNALGNNLSSEYQGTFDSGSVRNRTAAPTFLIPGYDYKNNVSPTVSVYDGSYAVINNSSPLGSTAVNSRFQPYCTSAPAVPVTDSCRNRMHGGFWDIMGDHTGSNNAAGNPPAKPGLKGGYMLMVNADVVTSEAYRQTVTGLCPDTYYEFSAWVKNICKRCAIDTNSVNTYKPGVYPNLSFSINGLDIYSTGQLDTTGWQKKGFIFKTAAFQTSALLSIRNNASGGGGNDWVLDDLSIGTCGPIMRLNYVPIFLGCGYGTLANLSDTIKYSYNPNYSWYKWERSTDGGVTWTDPPVAAYGFASTTYVNGYYQYVTNYPPFIAFAADSGHRYRVVVANSFANLSNPSCYFTDGNSTFLKIINCGSVLNADVISFTGRLQNNNNTMLQWMVTGEKNISKYEIEKSADGIHFNTIGHVMANQYSTLQEYQFNDNSNTNGSSYYRLKIISPEGLYKNSKVILVSRSYRFQVSSLLNPFSEKITTDIILPQEGFVKMILIDSYGKVAFTENKKLYKGLNKISYQGVKNLSSGGYYVLFDYNGSQVQKKLTKIN
jgi:hypothetical protein